MDFKKLLTNYINHYRGFNFHVWIELFAGVVNAGASVSVLFMAIYLNKLIGMSNIQVGWIVSAFGLGAMIGSIVGGQLSDKLPTSYVTTITLTISGIALFLFPFLNNFYYILFTVLILGIMNNAFLPANRTHLMNMTTEVVHHKISSIRYMLMNFGVGIYIFIDGRISSFGYKYLFLFNSIVILATSFLLVFAQIFIKFSNLEYQKNINKKNELSPNNPKKMVFITFYFSLLFTSFIFSQIRITYPLYLHSYYFVNESMLSNLFLINTILIATLQLPILNYFKSFNAGLTSGLGSLFIGLGMGLLFLSSNYWFAITLCATWTLGEILYFSTIQVLIFKHASRNKKGQHMGIYQFIISFSNMIGPIIGSYLYKYSNNSIWYLCLLLGIITLLLHKITHNTQTTT